MVKGQHDRKVHTKSKYRNIGYTGQQGRNESDFRLHRVSVNYSKTLIRKGLKKMPQQ